MGDRDFRGTIRGAIGSIGRELEPEIDAADHKTVHLREAVQCIRRSYYDRTDPAEPERRGFGELLPGLIRRLGHGPGDADYATGDSKLRARADMVVDDAVLLLRHAGGRVGDPRAADMLYLNACLWAYGKEEGMVVYVSGDGEEVAFSLARDRGMFEEVVRRSKVLTDMLEAGRIPIIEPSAECSGCQYYERCYVKRKSTPQISLAKMLGIEREK